MLEKLEAALAPPERKWLRVIIDGDDEAAKAKKKREALAEHVASHPEDAGRTVEDFNWIERTLVRPRVVTMANEKNDYGRLLKRSGWAAGFSEALIGACQAPEIGN